MSTETNPRPALSVRALDARLSEVEDTLISMSAALQDYENQEIGWFDVLDYWRDDLKRFVDTIIPQEVQHPPESPTEGPDGLPPAEGVPGDLPPQEAAGELSVASPVEPGLDFGDTPQPEEDSGGQPTET